MKRTRDLRGLDMIGMTRGPTSQPAPAPAPLPKGGGFGPPVKTAPLPPSPSPKTPPKAPPPSTPSKGPSPNAIAAALKVKASAQKIQVTAQKLAKHAPKASAKLMQVANSLNKRGDKLNMKNAAASMAAHAATGGTGSSGGPSLVSTAAPGISSSAHATSVAAHRMLGVAGPPPGTPDEERDAQFTFDIAQLGDMLNTVGNYIASTTQAVADAKAAGAPQSAIDAGNAVVTSMTNLLNNAAPATGLEYSPTDNSPFETVTTTLNAVNSQLGTQFQAAQRWQAQLASSDIKVAVTDKDWADKGNNIIQTLQPLVQQLQAAGKIDLANSGQNIINNIQSALDSWHASIVAQRGKL